MVKANWSGNSTCLCYGEWILEVNGIDVIDKIGILRQKMEGTYYDKKSFSI